MKAFINVLILAAILIGLGWLVWFKAPAPEEEKATPPTEVAVHVGRITRTTLRGYVTAHGMVEPAAAGVRPSASVRLAPAVAGVIAEVQCAEGQRVAKDELLFTMDSRAANLAVAFAGTNYERQKKLAEVDGTSQRALQEAQQQLDAARVQQDLLRIRSPLAGTVTRVNAKVGEAADLSTVLAEVVDLDRLAAVAHIPSAELATVKTGQTAEVLAGHSTPPIIGSVTYLSAEVDPRTGTALARIALPPGSGLLPGQFVTVRIVSAEHKDCLAVPVESVVKGEAGTTVISVLHEDMAVQIPVETGLRDRGLVEVEADELRPDSRVVTLGAYGLPKETRVRIVE